MLQRIGVNCTVIFFCAHSGEGVESSCTQVGPVHKALFASGHESMLSSFIPCFFPFLSGDCLLSAEAWFRTRWLFVNWNFSAFYL